VLADGHSLVYSWDGGNRLTEIDDTLSGVINQVIRVYDNLDRLTSETVNQGAAAVGTVTYTYDLGGRRATMKAGSQTKHCYTFDDADRLMTMVQGTGTTCGTGTVTLATFTYDDANRRQTVTLQNGVVGTYQYDNANELQSITYAKGTTTLGDVQYTYDPAGRIATRSGSLFKSVLPTATTATAVYNADNQLTSWNGVATSYDLNGNLTGDGTHSFTWDARNRMTGITGVASFVYDGVGRRLSVTQGATTTAMLYDGYDPVQEQSPIGTASANLQIGLGTDERFSRSVSGSASYFLTDLLGSTVGIANSAGTTVTTTYAYDPYGVTTTAGSANTSPYKFTGRQDDGTGLYYFRARYYNPAWGRFISEDPVGLAGGIDLYAYANGNPVLSIDPWGLSTQLSGGVGGTIGAFIVGGGGSANVGISIPDNPFAFGCYQLFATGQANGMVGAGAYLGAGITGNVGRSQGPLQSGFSGGVYGYAEGDVGTGASVGASLQGSKSLTSGPWKSAGDILGGSVGFTPRPRAGAGFGLWIGAGLTASGMLATPTFGSNCECQ